jgi:hypothetical protein
MMADGGSTWMKKMVREKERRRRPSAPFVAAERRSKRAPDSDHMLIEGGGSGLTIGQRWATAARTRWP